MAWAVAVVLLATLAGAVLGAASVLVPGPTYRATALVNAGPGATISASLDVPPDRANRFVQTELVAFDSDGGVVQGVKDLLDTTDIPPITADQVGDTDIIAISADDRDPAVAARTAQAAADVYIEGWRERASADVEQSLEVVDTRLDEVITTLDGLPPEGGSPAEGAQRDALRSEYVDLLREQADLTLRQQSVKTSERVVTAATADAAVRTASSTRAAMMGAALGLFVGVALVFVRYRRSIRGRRVWDL